MTEQTTGEFKELISPFLKKKLSDLEKEYGRGSKQFQAIARQYVMSEKEMYIDPKRQKIQALYSGYVR